MDRRQLLANCLLAIPAYALAKEEPVKLRPHHLLDILTSYGNGEKFEPHPYGHALHIVGPKVLAHLELPVTFVVAADDICAPCKHLRPDGTCDDVLSQLSPPISKQEYNDKLDRRVLACLDLRPGATLTARAYFELVNRHVPGIEKICTHPKEDEQRRLAGMIKGLEMLGIRKPEQA
jgi:hypothetical protein